MPRHSNMCSFRLTTKKQQRFALLALFAGPPVTGNTPHSGQVMQTFVLTITLSYLSYLNICHSDAPCRWLSVNNRDTAVLHSAIGAIHLKEACQRVQQVSVDLVADARPSGWSGKWIFHVRQTKWCSTCQAEKNIWWPKILKYIILKDTRLSWFWFAALWMLQFYINIKDTIFWNYGWLACSCLVLINSIHII